MSFIPSIYKDEIKEMIPAPGVQMPDWSAAVKITPPYTAKTPGWIYASIGTFTGITMYPAAYINGVVVAQSYAIAQGMNAGASTFVPIDTGDKLTVNSDPQLWTVYFIPFK